MMNAPISLARQKVGDQGEEEAGNRRKGGQTGTPTLGAYTTTGPTQSGVSDAKEQEKTWTVAWGSNP